MVKKRIEIKVEKELYNKLKKEANLKKYKDKQDLILDLLERKYIKTFFYRFKNLFFNK